VNWIFIKKTLDFTNISPEGVYRPSSFITLADAQACGDVRELGPAIAFWGGKLFNYGLPLRGEGRVRDACGCELPAERG
jgi:hypothetical protein